MIQTNPRIGLSKLRSLRGRERLFHVAWGVARWLTVVLAVVAVCTFIDWRVDKYRETPQWLRIGLTILEAVVLLVAGYFWLVRPWTKGPSIIRLARRVEDGIPEFGHRLVTSIQLSKKAGQREIGSPELVEAVARESEAIAEKHTFGRFADTRRLKWAAGLIGVPMLIAAGMIVLYGPNLLKVLLQRQLLASVEIPRLNQVESVKLVMLWPAGDEVTVEYIVSGKIRETDVGRLRVKPDGLPADEYQLEYAGRIDEDHTLFAARIPHSSVNFEHRAWVGDGRSKRASEVKFEPRPVVTKTDAWVRLPAFLGSKPNGQPYETYQAQGEITGLANNQARLRIAAQKPLTKAQVTLIARTKDGTGEFNKSTVNLLPAAEEKLPGGESEYPATGTFDLTPDLIAYSVAVEDANGFANSTPPRGIQIAPDDPPVVRLLPERYGELGSLATEEDIIEGLPIPIGGQIPIAFTCRSPQGVGKAFLRYRVNDRGPWVPLPLKIVDADPKWGAYDANRGTFQNAEFGLQVEFFPIPSPDRDTMPDYLTGGGRFDFQTAELTKLTEGGTLSKLEVGDRVEFYVEIHDRNPDPNRPPGRSESRIKELLTPSEVLQRLDQTRQAESKIRDLEKKQRGVFDRKQ